MPILAQFVRDRLDLSDAIVVSPDVGGVSRARNFAKHLGGETSLAIIDKHRQNHNQAEVLEVIGDVAGKTALIVDDVIDTAGTITQAAAVLRQRGAKKVSAIATHGLFSSPAKKRLEESAIEEIIVTDSLALPAEKCPANLHVVSVSQLLGNMIWRIYTKRSVSSLLSDTI
jgi:ribose-phosphate pyrophosphokinase